MTYPIKITNFNAFVDGVSYAGRVESGKMPEVKIQIDRSRGGGLDGSIPQDVGLEDMKAELKLIEWSPELLTLIGSRKRLVLRPVSSSGEGSFVATLGGLWATTTFGELKAGDSAKVDLVLEVDYFRLERDGEELLEIDIVAGKRVIGGVNQLEAQRAAMGI